MQVVTNVKLREKFLHFTLLYNFTLAGTVKFVNNFIECVKRRSLFF